MQCPLANLSYNKYLHAQYKHKSVHKYSIFFSSSSPTAFWVLALFWFRISDMMIIRFVFFLLVIISFYVIYNVIKIGRRVEVVNRKIPALHWRWKNDLLSERSKTKISFWFFLVKWNGVIRSGWCQWTIIFITLYFRNSLCCCNDNQDTVVMESLNFCFFNNIEDWRVKSIVKNLHKAMTLI